MTKEEYSQKLKEMVTDPDKAATIATELIDAIGTDTAANEKAMQESADKDKRIEDLQKQNMQLFLTRIGNSTDSSKPEEEEVITPETVARHFLDAYREKKGAK